MRHTASNQAHFQMVYRQIRSVYFFQQALCQKRFARMRCPCNQNNHRKNFCKIQLLIETSRHFITVWQSSKIKGETALNQEITTLRLSASLAMTGIFRQPESQKRRHICRLVLLNKMTIT